MNCTRQSLELSAILPSSSGSFGPCPTVMTEEELIQFLRIVEFMNCQLLSKCSLYSTRESRHRFRPLPIFPSQRGGSGGPRLARHRTTSVHAQPCFCRFFLESLTSHVKFSGISNAMINGLRDPL